MRPHDKQSSELRRHAVKRFILSFIVYCMAMFTFYAVFDIFLSPAIGNIIANNTSNWEYIASDDIDSLWDEHTMIQFDTSPEEDPSIIRYRALDTYAMLKTAKDDALPMVFVLGIAGLIFYSLNKFVGYFSELSESIAALFRDKSSPIVLSEELKVVQTELRSIQKESLQNERDAIESEQRKNELVAYIAHDLRTPLTSILGYTSLLKGRNFEAEKQGCFLEIIHSEAQKMNAMLDDFFDITRLNVRNFLLEKQAIDLRTLCLQITDELYPMTLDKDLSFAIKVPLNLPCRCDPKYLTRALANIIRNAITFASPKTEITIEAFKEASTANNLTKEANNEQLIIKITNKGKEISPDALPLIFSMFYREETSHDTKQNGAGLGLAITQSIITAHNGTISASCNDGITVFTITLP